MNRNRTGQYLVAAIGFFIVGVVALIIMTASLDSMSAKYTGISKEEEAIVLRTASLTENQSSVEEVNRMISSGIYSVGDYVIRSMTSADYLCKDVNDGAFAKDLMSVLWGSSDPVIMEEILNDLQSHTRMYAINNQVKAIDKKYTATSRISEDRGDSFEDCVINEAIGGVDGYTIGIRKVEGSFRSTGDEMRTDFFVDGTLYQGSIKVSDRSSEEKDFVMAWNTDGVDSGVHNVVILVRSSDGRGHLMDGGEIRVPECTRLADDSVCAGTLGFDCSWYIYTADNRDAYVNFVGLSDDIKVTIYDAYGNPVGTNDVASPDYEVARARMQDLDDITEKTGINGVMNTFYLKAEKGEKANPENNLIVYTVVTSKEVARYDGSFMAVLSDVGSVPTSRPLVGYAEHPDVVSLRDANGNDLEANFNSISFVPLNGTLVDFSVCEKLTGANIGYFPSYTRREVNYGYYVNGENPTITVTANPQEGYAAQLELTVTNSEGVKRISSGDDVVIEDGETVITASVTSFSGNVKEYRLFILNGDDDGDFCETTLVDFPDSYKAGLWMLHSIHPNYNFRAYNTGLDFYTVLDNEDSGSRSLANVYSHPGWVVPDSPVYDGGGWMAAEEDVVQYFLDPRNFLEQEHIFQFEMLSFDSTAQTMDGIDNILEGSFMDTNSPDYATIIYNAGETANVSPYFLASRIIQEMGYSGESPLCHGTLPGYEGYYNFFDIGATPDPDIANGAQINGAKYAMYGAYPDEKEITEEERELMIPWDSVEKSITGGALWIASRYTAAGQDTLYFQKFDVINNEDGLYQHQYAQNISMAYSEGARYFDGYASIDMLDNSFTFLIPVYNNMPTEYGTMPQA
ncbi:MAG: hypothetical protein MJ093_04510 [Saccharofermentans sp.]|nr:hypothetical protein [Saccharofermentans sp.]